MRQRLLDTALKVARRGRGTLRAVVDSPTRLRREAQHVRNVVSSVAVDADADRHVLLASTGVRNIGDQAMVESFISNVAGPIDLIVLSKSTYVVPVEAIERVHVVVLDSLAYGRGSAQHADLQRFAAMMRRAKSFSVVGADIIDGGYQLRAPVMSWALASGAAEAGIDSRVLGFSWGAEADPVVIEGASAAASAGVKLFPRDPDSAARLQESGVHPLFETVDTVFALQGDDSDSEDFERLISPIRARDARFILMNISGLIAGRVDLTADYLAIARAAVDEDVEIILIPHVDNRGGSDKTAVARFSEVLREAGIEHGVVEDLMRPLQVRKLARHAAAVVTGRMHLSILALSTGTPAIVLSTQGKVSGLMARIGHPEWCVEPVPGMSDAAIGALRGALSSAGTESLRGLPAELAHEAQMNFAGLGHR